MPTTKLPAASPAPNPAPPVLVAAVLPSQEVAPAVLAALARPDREVLLAHAAAPLLGRLPVEATFRPLQLRLLEVAKLVGLAEVPDEHQLAAAADFVRDHFGDLTLPEVTEAVRRWAAGELDVPPGERPYGTLALPWLGTVLRAYRQRRAAALRAAQAEERRAAAAQVPPPLTPAEWDARACWLVRTHGRDGALPAWSVPLVDWDACWRFLHAAGALPALAPDEAEELLASVRLGLEQRAQAAVQAGRPDEAAALRRILQDPTRRGLYAEARALRARRHYLTLIDTTP